MLGFGFWICAALAVINFVIAIISLERNMLDDGKWNMIAFVICTLGAGGNAIVDLDANKSDKKYVIENIKTLQVDTTYIVNKDKVDTVYKVNYFKYEKD